ncbi:MAG TPA: hypothetical protein VNZ26_24890, partial [Vicinamibacterales bacterium]|nr:hypothetical protein [Vicinamibacterales bacterium]
DKALLRDSIERSSARPSASELVRSASSDAGYSRIYDALQRDGRRVQELTHTERHISTNAQGVSSGTPVQREGHELGAGQQVKAPTQSSAHGRGHGIELSR